MLHWLVLVVYGAGLGLAWHHRQALAAPFASSFGTLLTLKTPIVPAVHRNNAGIIGAAALAVS